MNERMTDKRLAEIGETVKHLEHLTFHPQPQHALMHELLAALKAERECIAELEKEKAAGQWYPYQEQVR